jgi:hypothetical protein
MKAVILVGVGICFGKLFPAGSHAKASTADRLNQSLKPTCEPPGKEMETNA